MSRHNYILRNNGIQEELMESTFKECAISGKHLDSGYIISDASGLYMDSIHGYSEA